MLKAATLCGFPPKILIPENSCHIDLCIGTPVTGNHLFFQRLITLLNKELCLFSTFREHYFSIYGTPIAHKKYAAVFFFAIVLNKADFGAK
jgi:hypothetical protein